MVMAGMERLRTNNARIDVAMGRLAGELDRDRTKPELHFLSRVQASAVGGSALQRRVGDGTNTPSLRPLREDPVGSEV